jgi:hypothetical protein
MSEDISASHTQINLPIAALEANSFEYNTFENIYFLPNCCLVEFWGPVWEKCLLKIIFRPSHSPEPTCTAVNKFNIPFQVLPSQTYLFQVGPYFSNRKKAARVSKSCMGSSVPKILGFR